MIIDTMSKYEVMKYLREEFDEEIIPFYIKRILPRIKPILQQQGKREKKTITLGWETIKSKSLNTFKILKRGNKDQHFPLFTAEFWWNNKLCFAYFAPKGNVIIYQSHCLQRYAERILKQDIDSKVVFYNHIVKQQDSAFRIVLPTKTHKYSHYFVTAKALFLGDFDEKHCEDCFVWLNTCISYNDAKYSQYQIMKSLNELQRFIENTGCDFSNPENKKFLEEYLKKYKNEKNKIDAVTKFLIQYYLLLQLHLSFNFTFTEIFREDIDKELEHLKFFLSKLDIDINLLSPFSGTYRIVEEGEIDYVESR